MIHRALSSIPARPVLYIAPLIVVAGMVFYYSGLKSECLDRSSRRQAFVQQVTQAASSGSLLKLADITDFPWQQVKGFAQFKPQRETGNCPFGWDWSSAQRRRLIASGLLSVLIFFNEGSVSKYIEFSGDRILMDDFDKALTPDTAVFAIEQVEQPGYAGGAVARMVFHGNTAIRNRNQTQHDYY